MTAILFSQMEPAAGDEALFNEWYEREHVPSRLSLSGFIRATRYRVEAERPAYLAVYEVEGLEVFETSAYRALKARPSKRTATMLEQVSGFTRYLCSEQGSFGNRGAHEYLSVVAFPVPAADRGAFDDWYDREHVPMLLEAKDWLAVRRYRVVSAQGGPWTDLALHELRSAAAMESPQRATARDAPMRRRLAQRPWFGESGRWLYRLISDRAA